MLIIKKLKKIGKLLQFVVDPDYRFIKKAQLGRYDQLSDEEYLKRMFRARMKKELDLENPQTFNEKLQWLKLYDRRPEYTVMVDKFAVKQYVAERIGEEYIIPTLGVWEKFEDIDFGALPNQFVLKCTHDSGGLVICRDKSKLNKKKAEKKIRRALDRDFFLVGREWPYKDVPRKIIVEKYLEDAQARDIKDYKFMCFNGEVKCSFVCTERSSRSGLHVTFFDREWHVMPFQRHYPSSVQRVNKPQNYDVMIKMAEELSRAFPFVRVDFYEVNGRVYFGELTFYPGGGFEEFEPEEWDYTLGSWLTLPLKITEKSVVD